MTPVFSRQLLTRCDEHRLPPATSESLVAYIMTARPTGGFLGAVLENNLREAFCRADEANTEALPRLVAVLYNYAPSACWGSPEKVREWRGVK